MSQTRRARQSDSHGSWFAHDSFFKEAKALRREFDERFADPKQTHSERFVWDYWHVPNQYTLVRTPAYHYFSQELYARLQERLLQFGREQLGCAGITPPWLSYYVEGCRQELHADVPHGPWAFVFSLTQWEQRKFTGGETLILKPSTLNYWTAFDTFQGVEMEDLAVRVPAEFNRLLIFDPRIPHGVTPVRGTHDPREARLVIHGWFTDPQPFIEGTLSRAAATKRINDILEDLQPLFEEYADLHGTLSLRFEVTPAGTVRGFQPLTNTLLSLMNDNARIPSLLAALKAMVMKTTFPKSQGTTRITLPILFRF